MDDFGKKTVVAAIAIVCLTIAIISSFSVGNIVYPIKSIIKNIENDKSYTQNSAQNVQNDEFCVREVKSGTSGAVCIEQSSKRVLFEDGKDVLRYPASTTKILTALIAIERLPLDKKVIVQKYAEGVEGSSIYLKEGDEITVEDLLYGLMLRSGNDAAVTLAIEVAGSVEAFADIMNERAKEIGARNSHFVNPHGLHDDNHYTTAYDLALVCAKAYENDVFCGLQIRNKGKSPSAVRTDISQTRTNCSNFSTERTGLKRDIPKRAAVVLSAEQKEAICSLSPLCSITAICGTTRLEC